MAISMLTNTTSLAAQRNLNASNSKLSDSITRLSSGMRINKASDDAAGLGISSKLTAQTKGLVQAQRNANDGVSMLQTAEGGLAEVGNILSRMRELSVEAANGGTLGNTERGYLQSEFAALSSEVNRISATTEYNGQALLDGSASGLALQVGIHNTANDKITFSVAQTDASSLGIATLNIGTAAGAGSALDALDAAIQTVSASRGNIGAIENRLTSTVNNLASMQENFSAANSRILDVDVAEETAALSRNQVLVQAGTAVLSQANQMTSTALSLLKG
jgi:flagellin